MKEQRKLKTIKYRFMTLVMGAVMATITSCREGADYDYTQPTDAGDLIHIGGLSSDVLAATVDNVMSRAAGDDVNENIRQDAENLPWLRGPLFDGLDITYGLSSDASTRQVAILQLQKDGENVKYVTYFDAEGIEQKVAEYTFNYRSDGKPAQWYGNGQHTFEGVYVPSSIRYGTSQGESTTADDVSAEDGSAPGLTTNQSKDGDIGNGKTGNYTLLERYLGMPANTRKSATIERIKLPFSHRLARVITYILVDPTMGSDVKIQGYNYSENKDAEGNIVGKMPDNPETSAIRFCNVDVLKAVHDVVGADNHATLTPEWTTARKAIPHFVDERGSVDKEGNPLDDNFLLFYDKTDKVYIFPTNTTWASAKSDWNTAYNAATGTDVEKEEKANEESRYIRTNYGHVPCYDLIVRPTYSSYNTVMYDEEGYDNESTRTELANKANKIDFEITLNSGLHYTKQCVVDLDANDQTVVFLRISRESIDYNSSGSAIWQENRGDDGYYGVNNRNGNTLSIAGSSWQRAYRFKDQNYNVTDGHQYKWDSEDEYAQYVTQTNWLKMFTQAHTGATGEHHGDYFILDDDIYIDASLLPVDFVFTGHLDGQNHTIHFTGGGETVVDQEAWDEPNYTETADYDTPPLYYLEGEEHKEFTNPTNLYRMTQEATYYTSEDQDVIDGVKQVGDKKTDAVYEQYTPSTKELMEGTFYTDDQGTPYTPPTKLYAYTPIHHDAITHVAPSYLFKGLDGTYATTQETNVNSTWEANVHKERNNVWVPVKGYRAELLNVKLQGARFFPEDAVFTGQKLTKDGASVSGYIYNCWEDTNKVTNEVPLARY